MIPQFITAAQYETAKRFDFTWSEVAGATYTLYRDGIAIATDLIAAVYSDTTVDYYAQHIYAVTATVDDIESAKSLPVMLTASAAGLPFATVSDLTDYWKAPDNATRAEYLIKLASNRLRSLAGTTFNLDTMAAADPLYRDALQGVVLEAVKRAMLTPEDRPAMESFQQTAGPYSENIKYSNPAGDLFFKKSELSLLGLSGGQSLSSIGSTPNHDIYREQIED